MSLKSNYIIKLEDECFISKPTSEVRNEHLVIISELAEKNLEDYIKDYVGPIPEQKIMQLFV